MASKAYTVLPDKAWYKSTTVGGAVVLGVYAAWCLVTRQAIDFEIAASLAGAFGLVGLRRVLGGLKGML